MHYSTVYFLQAHKEYVRVARITAVELQYVFIHSTSRLTDISSCTFFLNYTDMHLDPDPGGVPRSDTDILAEGSTLIM